MILNYLLYWIPMIFIAFINAAIREWIFIKRYTELRAHQFSTITLIIFCLVYTEIIFRNLKINHPIQALAAGAIWLLMTVLFEFTLGRLSGRSWQTLLQDYRLGTGHIWPLFLISLFIIPICFYLLKK